MKHRLPLLPTLIVAAAVATMIGLGIWQLRRAEWKADLIARYTQAQSMSSAVAWPSSPAEYDRVLYRHSRINCTRVVGIDARAGRSQAGESGWAHVARCLHDGRGVADVAIGWSREPTPPEWSGGEVGGFIGPYGRVVRLVAAPPQAGLEQLALPDPNDLPNNHLMYAGQWFFFALTAVVIYVLALRRRQADTPQRF